MRTARLVPQNPLGVMSNLVSISSSLEDESWGIWVKFFSRRIALIFSSISLKESVCPHIKYLKERKYKRPGLACRVGKFEGGHVGNICRCLFVFTTRNHSELCRYCGLCFFAKHYLRIIDGWPTECMQRLVFISNYSTEIGSPMPILFFESLAWMGVSFWRFMWLKGNYWNIH